MAVVGNKIHHSRSRGIEATCQRPEHMCK